MTDTDSTVPAHAAVDDPTATTTDFPSQSTAPATSSTPDNSALDLILGQLSALGDKIKTMEATQATNAGNLVAGVNQDPATQPEPTVDPDPDDPTTIPPVVTKTGTQVVYDIKEDGTAILKAVKADGSELFHEYKDKAEAYAEHGLIGRLVTLLAL